MAAGPSLDVRFVGKSVVDAMVKEMPFAVRAAILHRMEGVGRTLLREVRSERLADHRRTAMLSRAVFFTADDVGDDVIGVLGADMAKAVYARVQDLGGRIVVKKARNLTIPIGAALTGNGVARFTARQLIVAPQNYGYTGSFVAKGIIFGRIQGAGLGSDVDKVVPLFVLKPAVVIKAIGYLSKTVEERRAYVVAELQHGVADALRKLKIKGEDVE